MIDYRKLAEAEEYYTTKWNFEKIDVPWIVGDAAYGVTKPPDARDFATFAGNLVASGEQSFIQMMIDGKLGTGMYLCTTSCYRDDKPDRFHRTRFVKTELIWRTHDDGNRKIVGMDLTWRDISVQVMVWMAKSFYDWYLKGVEVVKTNEGYDLYAKGVELGSYGYRSWGEFHWIYGTGCAEPRLSQVIELESKDA